jgi:hypothetical protein
MKKIKIGGLVIESISNKKMDDIELKKILEEHHKTQSERIQELEIKIIEVDRKMRSQLKGSNFDFKAYLGLGIGAIALVFLFSVSFTVKNGKAQFSYESEGLLKGLLSFVSASSAAWGGLQHYKSIKEKFLDDDED